MVLNSAEVRCVNDRDESIPSEDCMIHLGPVPSVTVPCWVACDQDVCKFSDWTDWGACTQRCNGVQTRTRSMEGEVRIIRFLDYLKHHFVAQLLLVNCLLLGR